MKCALVSLLVLALPYFASASDTTRTSIPNIVIQDLLIGLCDAGAYYTAPLRFSQHDWFLAGGLIGAAGIGFAADSDIKRRLAASGREDLDGFWKLPIDFGKAEYENILGAGLYTAGLILAEDDLRVTGRLLVESIAFSGSIVMVMRFSVGRTRPLLSDDAGQFNGFEPAFREQSFPSGHAAVGFATASVLAGRINRTWATAGLYSLASLGTFAQLYNQQHWLSDLVVGGVLGLTSGLFVLGREGERRTGGGNAEGFRLVPTPTGLRLTYLLR